MVLKPLGVALLKSSVLFSRIFELALETESCVQNILISLFTSPLSLTRFWGQVTQLDLTIKEHRSELQQKVITLEHALNQARYELSERAVEVNNTRNKSLFIVIINRTVTSIRKVLSQKR